MATRGPQQRIDIGTVIGIGFRSIARNFLPFAGFAVLLVGLPNFLLQYFAWQGLQEGDITFLSAPYWIGVAVTWLTAYLLQGIVVGIVVRDVGGQEVDSASAASAALGRLFPMIALSIVSGVAIAFGLVLLIVPGIILMLMWMVAVPVLVEERLGVFESLGRSAELTRGSKGWVFLLLLLYWGVSSMLSGVVFAVTGFQLSFADSGAMLLPIVAGSVVQALNGLLLAAMLAALYVELRQFRDGAAPDRLAAIFE